MMMAEPSWLTVGLVGLGCFTAGFLLAIAWT